jgi:HlyD family secretion protein
VKEDAMLEHSKIRHALTPRRVVLAGVGVLAVTGLVSVFRPDPTTVDMATVQRMPLRVTVDADAKTRVRDRYIVTTPVAGRLERLPLSEGDSVRAGDPVAGLAPAPLDESTARQARARLDAAEAVVRNAASGVALAEASSAQATRDAERARRLFAVGGIARRDLEAAELAERARTDEVSAARARASVAAADVRQARAALLATGVGGKATMFVRAPVAGHILRLADRSERVVPPGSMIAEIGDTRAMEVVVDVLSSDAALVRSGMPVLLDGWGGDRTCVGHVRRVEPAATTRVSALGVEEQRVNVIVDVPDPPQVLGDGYGLDARIVVWQADSVLAVPTSALVRSGTDWAVYAVDGGRAERRVVRIGRIGEAAAQVLGGVSAGERVIVFPSDKVRDGGRVASARK